MLCNNGQIERATKLLLAVVLFVSYAYFFSGGGWNQASRFSLVRAIADYGELTVDRFEMSTGDKSFHDGHYYCDKAPGTSFLAVPVYIFAKYLFIAFGLDVSDESVLRIIAWLVTAVCIALPSALAGVSIFSYLRVSGANRTISAATVLSAGLASPWFAYSTLFWGHALAGSLLVVTFVRVIIPSEEAEVPRIAFLLGLLLGWAVTVEFPAAIPALAIGIVGMLKQIRFDRRAVLSYLLSSCAGAAIPTMLLFWYNYRAFGSPLAISYQAVVGFEGMRTGFLGVTSPSSEILWQLFFGSTKGLLWVSPAVVLGLVGHVWALCSFKERAGTLLALGIFGYYVCFNASYYYWSGGWSVGPRILGGGLPFASLGLASLFNRPVWTAWLASVVSVFGAFMMLISVAVNVTPPDNLDLPTLTVLPQRFWEGSVAQMDQSLFSLKPTLATNIGLVLGLEGKYSVLPLIFVWIALLLWLVCTRRADRLAE